MERKPIVTKQIEIDPRELKLLEVNARYMRHEEFARLVANIAQDGALTSAPFAVLDGDAYLVLSGNHRVKASIEAGLKTIPCITTDDELSEEQRLAIQLSHNAIAGTDDPNTLKELYEKILDVGLKEYSGLDDKVLGLLDSFNAISMAEANIKYQTLSLVFLPDDLKTAQQVLANALDRVKMSDATWLIRMEEYDRWLDSQEAVASSHNVKNAATAVLLMLELFERNLSQLSEAWEDWEQSWESSASVKRWVPIESVVGRRKIPVESAKVIKKALDRMTGRGDITEKNLWQGIEYLCADYLAAE
jgi:hypothetical protein